MDPISPPLARVRDVNLVSERLTVRNTTLCDTDGTIVPGRRIQKHAMVVEGTGSVQVVGRMNDESVIHADGDRRRARSLYKNGEETREEEGEDRRPSTIDANRTSWHA